MDTSISTDNPFGYNRYGYAWEHVPEGTASHLDFGCYQGRFLEGVRKKSTGYIAGVDVSTDAISEAKERYDGLDFLCVAAKDCLPFEAGYFKSITLLDVIEHVADQVGVLRELNRVLSDEGVLIVTVPGRHIFSFLDMGNFKFYFPRLHRWYYCRNHSREEYERRYVSNPAGLIGDVSAEKGLHEHFSRRKLGDLLSSAGFSVTGFDGSGLFRRPLGIVDRVLGRIKPVHKLLQKLISLDSRSYKSMNLFCVARRSG